MTSSGVPKDDNEKFPRSIADGSRTYVPGYDWTRLIAGSPSASTQCCCCHMSAAFSRALRVPSARHARPFCLCYSWWLGVFPFELVSRRVDGVLGQPRSSSCGTNRSVDGWGARCVARSSCCGTRRSFDGPGSALRAPKGQANAGPKPSVVRILALSRKAL